MAARSLLGVLYRHARTVASDIVSGVVDGFEYLTRFDFLNR